MQFIATVRAKNIEPPVIFFYILLWNWCLNVLGQAFSSRLLMTLPLHIDNNLNKKLKFTFIPQLTLIFIPVVE